MPKMKPCTPKAPKEEPYTVGMEQVGDRIRIRIYTESGVAVDEGILAVIFENGTLHTPASVASEAARRAGIRLDYKRRIASSVP